MTRDKVSTLLLFGATGDLAHRMLLPSLYSLQAERLLPDGMRILGTARSELDRDGFAKLVADSIAEHEDLECHNKARALLAAVPAARRMTARRRTHARGPATPSG